MDDVASLHTDISILCVEDEPMTREFLVRFITASFPENKVHTAENGQAGLECFRESRIDIVLTDIKMPVMDGIRMAREIRLLKPEACIIAMTAQDDHDFPKDAFNLFDRHVLKPVSRKCLCEAVGECITLINAKKPESE